MRIGIRSSTKRLTVVEGSEWAASREVELSKEFTIHQFFNESAQHRIAKGIFVSTFFTTFFRFVCDSVYVRGEIVEKKNFPLQTTDEVRVEINNVSLLALPLKLKTWFRLAKHSSGGKTRPSENFLFVFIKYLIFRPFSTSSVCEISKKCKSTVRLVKEGKKANKVECWSRNKKKNTNFTVQTVVLVVRNKLSVSRCVVVLTRKKVLQLKEHQICEKPHRSFFSSPQNQR